MQRNHHYHYFIRRETSAKYLRLTVSDMAARSRIARQKFALERLPRGSFPPPSPSVKIQEVINCGGKEGIWGPRDRGQVRANHFRRGEGGERGSDASRTSLFILLGGLGRTLLECFPRDLLVLLRRQGLK